MSYKVIVLSPQRSGTNYLQFLLKRNFYHVRVLYEHEYIWKHYAYPSKEKKLDPNIIHIGVIKNPYKWIESLRRYSADLSDNFGKWKRPMPEYNNSRERFYVEDRNGKKIDVEHAIKLYNKFYTNWMKQKSVTFAVIKYEDLIDNKQNVYEQIVQKTNLRCKPKPWYDTKKVDQSDDFTEQTRTYYLNETDLSLTTFQMEVIKNTVDPTIMNKFGYKLL